ncbi:dCTP deaminase [Fictibacillus sp. FJAT-27399]|uniref:dCTP deaminase n=1 Tax=Fictibacillus sp. FJAT-27399 TaxID=1729689 RepID=UPI000784DBA5|nr:dCTP deaminase [Fictibacillus sp. FJAT-27399]
MLLSDKHLKELAINNELVTPFIEENCEGATINLTLDTQIKRYTSSESIVMGSKLSDEHYQTIDINEEDFYLKPNESVLVQAYEYFKIPTNMAAIILERYSIKLMGLVVSPASYMNPGYEGRLSFLITNNTPVPVQLISGVKFCQLAITELTSVSDKPYTKQDGKYMGSREVHISKLHLDKDIQEYLLENGLGEISGESARMLGRHLMKRIEENAKHYADVIRQKLGDADESIT